MNLKYASAAKLSRQKSEAKKFYKKSYKNNPKYRINYFPTSKNYKYEQDILFSLPYEYVTVDGNIGYIGISDYAQHALGNVSLRRHAEQGDDLEAGDEFGAGK